MIRLCTDLGLKEVQDYASELRKLENAQNEASQESRRIGTGIPCAHFSRATTFYFFIDLAGLTYSSGRGSRLSSAASGGDQLAKSQPTSAQSDSYHSPIGNFTRARTEQAGLIIPVELVKQTRVSKTGSGRCTTGRKPVGGIKRTTNLTSETTSCHSNEMLEQAFFASCNRSN